MKIKVKFNNYFEIEKKSLLDILKLYRKHYN